MDRRSDCPIACALDLLGDKWSLLILRDMLFFEKTRFDEFTESPEQISTNILTDRLHKLESDGFVAKVRYSNHRYRYEYVPTDKAKTLTPLLKEFVSWGLRNCKGTRKLAMPKHNI